MQTKLKNKISKEQKKEIVSSVKEKIESSHSILLVSSEGIPATTISQFRKELASYNAKYIVIKKTLFIMGVKQSAARELENFYKGLCGIIVCNSEADTINVTKFVYNWSKDNPKLKILCGFINNKLVSVEKIIEIANLPSKEVLIYNLLLILNSPIVKFYNVLRTPIVSLLNILATKSKSEKS